MKYSRICRGGYSYTPAHYSSSTHRTSRFILNLPEEELASVERVCFQVEQAYVMPFIPTSVYIDHLRYSHWYYEDFIREQHPSKFPSYTLKTFSEALFRACPLLAHWAEDHDRTFDSFMKYKTRVPVCGAIMLNDTWDKVGGAFTPYFVHYVTANCWLPQCVLVKGWKSSAGWGFPKGKINEQEPRHRCAIREVRRSLPVSDGIMLKSSPRFWRRPAMTWRIN